jgi:Lipocalin-like domain
MIMRAWFLTAALSFIFALAQPAEAQDSTSPIVGVWKLTSYARKEVGTEKTFQPLGEHPTGYRVVTRGGHAFIMFFAENRKAPAGAITDADPIDLFKTMVASRFPDYGSATGFRLAAGGTYKVEGNKFFFQGDVSASQIANKFTYEFEITGSKLKMTAGPFKDPASGPDTVVVTTYDRVE